MGKRRSSLRSAVEPGQDSFLDIVANLVGILIILVMVVAVRARDAIVVNQASRDQDQSVVTGLEPAKQAVVAVTQDIHRIDQLLKRQDFEVAFRRKERDKVLAIYTSVQGELEQQRQQLSEQQQQELTLRDQVVAAVTELDTLQRQRSALEKKSVPEKIIEHYPTPMVKTVFGQEVHFQLKLGRLAHIPWDSFIARLRDDAPRHVWKLKDAARVTELLGPVDGFRMQYTLINKHNAIDTPNGQIVRRQIELEKFELFPVSDDLGELVERALQPGSKFLATVAQQDQQRGTVTIWVYPDSFGQFRQVRNYLHQNGYTCASRPLPDGHPIGGSPRGTRSLSQ